MWCTHIILPRILVHLCVYFLTICCNHMSLSLSLWFLFICWAWYFLKTCSTYLMNVYERINQAQSIFFFHSQVKHISFLDNEKRSKPTHENNKKSKIWNNIELASGESESWRKLKLWSLDNHAHWSYFQAPLFYLLVICVSSSLFTDEKSDCVFTLGQNHQYIRCESQANACNRHILRIHLIVICVDQQ